MRKRDRVAQALACLAIGAPFGGGGVDTIRMAGGIGARRAGRAWKASVVQGGEVLIRALYSPVFINKATGEVDPAAFTDALARGLSVQRLVYIAEDAHLAKIEQKIADDQAAGKPGDGFWRVVTARCGDIQALLRDDGGRSFCVYDTGKPSDQAHADVCQAFELPPETQGRKVLNKKLRHQLFEAFVGIPTDLATVYNANGQ